MKVAYHFDSSAIGSSYGDPPKVLTYGALLSQRAWAGSTKVLYGDLLVANDRGDVKRTRLASREWLSTEDGQWSSVRTRRFLRLAPQNGVYCIVFESVEATMARSVNHRLRDYGPYLGAQELFDSNNVQLALVECLIVEGRIDGNSYYVFVMTKDPIAEDAEEWKLDDVRSLGVFKEVAFELTSGRFTIFDDREWPELPQRAAYARRSLLDLHSTMVERVMAEYGDAMPAFPDIMFAATDAFERAETSEQFAHVATSCRRVLDQLADQLYPAREGDPLLGPLQSKNRLREFVRLATVDSKNRAVVEREIDDIFKRLSALGALNSRLVHADVTRDGARRCLIQTIVLLDDIRGLVGRPLPMTIRREGLTKVVKRLVRDGNTSPSD